MQTVDIIPIAIVAFAFTLAIGYLFAEFVKARKV